MADMRLLERTLAENVAWNKARINFLARFIVALIEVRSVNLSEIAAVFTGHAKRESHYKRAQRFLRFFEVPYAQVARFLVRLLGVPAPWVITMDRTDWYLGNTPLNLLVIGIAYRGVAFPLLWTVLEKKGRSDTSERIALLGEFGRVFGYRAIAYLCADREFIGRDWFAHCARSRWTSASGCARTLRSRMDAAGGPRLATVPFAAHLGAAQHRAGARRLGVPLFLTGARLSSGEYVIVVTPCATVTALADYARRWEIETLFSCLKSRGFRLEETHVMHPERLKKLVALLAFAFCWAYSARSATS